MIRLSQVRLACLFAAAILATFAFCGPARADFTPPANCTLWLDAGTITGVADGDPLASWDDLIGPYTFTALGVLPTYHSSVQNGQPAVHFTGPGNTVKDMRTPFTHPADVMTVFAVAQSDTDPETEIHGRLSYFNLGSYKPYLPDGSEPRHVNFGLLMKDGYGPHDSFTAHVPHGNPCCEYGEDGNFNNNWNVHAYTVNGQDPVTDWQGYLNGTAFGQYYNTSGGLPLDPTEFAYVGGNDTGDNWNGYVAEVLLFDRVLTRAEIDTVNAYLLEKYAIPEPTSMALLLTGGLALVAYAWRKRRWCFVSTDMAQKLGLG